MPLPAVVDLGTYVGPLDHRPWTSRPALFKSLIFISSCDSHLSFSTKPECCLFQYALFSPDSGRPSSRRARRRTQPPNLRSIIGCRRLAGPCSRRARPRCSHAGWASTRRQRRWRSCSTLSRPRRAPWEVPPHGGARPLCGAAAATPPPQRPARRAQGHPLSSTGSPGAAPTPKRACGGALLPTQHRPLTAPSSAASNA